MFRTYVLAGLAMLPCVLACFVPLWCPRGWLAFLGLFCHVWVDVQVKCFGMSCYACVCFGMFRPAWISLGMLWFALVCFGMFG